MTLTREIADKIKKGIESGKIPSVLMTTRIFAKTSLTSMDCGPIHFSCFDRKEPEFGLMNEIHSVYWEKITAEQKAKEQAFLDSL